MQQNLESEISEENTLWKITNELEIEKKLRAFNKNVALQGEVIGEGIQKNIYKINGQKVFLFSVFDIDANKFLDYKAFIETLAMLELPLVPILETDYLLSNNINILVNKSIGKSVLHKDAHREGIVLRPLIAADFRQSRDSFKAINPNFLLKYE